MVKVKRKPTELLYPCPITLVTSVDKEGKPNIIPIAWVGVACRDPPIIGIAMRPSRHSDQLISQTKEFVVNIPTIDLLWETDYCGKVSGRDHDKFLETKLTPVASKKVKPPLIGECPVNLECVLRQTVKLGTHDLFLGEVVAVHVDESILGEDGKIDFSKARPIVYNRGEYWSLGERVGLRRRIEKPGHRT